MLKRIGHWIRDYLNALNKHSMAFFYQKPPRRYLGQTAANKCPVILIPGVYEKWYFLKALADPISRAGHPVYVLENLGYNTMEIHSSALLVRKLIVGKSLRNVVILAHSKGGLIGKYVLAFDNKDRRVKKLIAIASPFGGSDSVRFFRHRPFLELHPEHKTIKTLQEQTKVNRKIVSIFGIYDNHVWPVESCRLEGAKNIQVESHGHHQILSNKKVKQLVLAEVEKV